MVSGTYGTSLHTSQTLENTCDFDLCRENSSFRPAVYSPWFSNYSTFANIWVQFIFHLSCFTFFYFFCMLVRFNKLFFWCTRFVVKIFSVNFFTKTIHFSMFLDKSRVLWWRITFFEGRQVIFLLTLIKNHLFHLINLLMNYNNKR